MVLLLPYNSPSHGDQRILGSFIWQDEQAMEKGDTLPFGFARLLLGTMKYFIAFLLDFGYIFEPSRPMKADENIGKITFTHFFFPRVTNHI